MQSERNKTGMGIKQYLKQEIRDNICKIIGDRDTTNIKKIIVKRLRFTIGSRSIFKVDIDFLIDNSLEKKSLIIKKIGDSERTFKEHKKIFDRCKEKGIRQLLPKPYFYIKDRNYIAMEYIYGKSLLKAVLFKLTIRSYHSLIDIFKNLGISLANFHSLSTNYNSSVTLDKAINDTIEKLKISNYFNKKEKTEIHKHLTHGNDLLGSDYKISVSRLYNDWTLRNFIINKNSKLKVIDTDAMTHPHLPDCDVIWNDISTFLINVESQTKYYPLINKNHLLNLEKNFIDGYNEMLDKRYTSEEINFLHYITVLKFYLGRVEYPLKKIYPGYLNSRYLKTLKKSITLGSGSIFGKFY